MRIQTRHWGEQEVDDDRVLTFEEGLPGFPDCRRFVMLGSAGSAFLWLQSVDRAEVALPVAEAFGVFPDYDVDLDADDVDRLGITDLARVVVFVVVTVRGDPAEASANLLAPIIVNSVSRRGYQKVLSKPDYSVRHLLFPHARVSAD